MYDWSAQNNELGNPMRNPVTGTPGNYGADTGGLIVDGVAPDGTKNEVRANFNIYANPYDTCTVYNLKEKQIDKLKMNYHSIDGKLCWKN